MCNMYNMYIRKSKISLQFNQYFEKNRIIC